MARKGKRADERNGNAALEHADEQIQNPDQRPPHHEETTASPRRQSVEAPIDSPAREENPPQTDGPRERNNRSV